MAEFMDLDEDDFDTVEESSRVYRSHVDPYEKYDDINFRKRFRFAKASVERLVEILSDDLRRVSARRCTISPEVQVLLALRYYGGNAYQMTTGDTIHVSQPTVSRSITAVSKALCGRLDEFIKIPTLAEAPTVQRAFFDIAGFSNVIGCLGCTHVKISAPKEHEEQFVNRNGFHAINVQACCDADYRFTNVVVKYPACTHDSYIFSHSQLFANFERDSRRGILIGDAAYACRHWLMTPYESPATAAERNFNDILERTRCRIDATIGQLKRRFKLLQQKNRRKLENVVSDTAACFILHNFAKQVNDPLDDFEVLPDEVDVEEENQRQHETAHVSGQRRKELIIAQRITEIQHRQDTPTVSGLRRRDIIAQSMYKERV